MAFPDLGSLTDTEISSAGAGHAGDVSADASTKDNDRYNVDGGKTGGVLVNPDTKNPFWQTATVEEANWNKSFPFQLVLLEKGETEYSIVGGQSYTMPIPPQALTISTPFAIHGQVTLGGYHEAHNGSPIRILTLQGTTGVLPARTSAEQASSFGVAGAIFAGTIQGIRQAAAGVEQAVFGGGALNKSNLVEEDITAGKLKATTGYFQFMMLRSYLEHYGELRKTRGGSKYRLAFAIWKDKEFYLVKPDSFDMQRSAASPLEYTYNIRFTAWRRWVPNQNRPPVLNHKPVARDANALAQVMNRVAAARRALQGVKNTLTGFRADVDAILFAPMRELGLFVKDVIGVGMTAGDLPVNIVRDMKSSVLQATSTVGDLQALQQGFTSMPGRVSAEVQDLGRRLRNLSIISGIAATQADPMPPVGVLRQAQDSGSLGANEADPANSIFNDPDANPDFFAKLQVGALNLKPQVAKRIVEERLRVRNLTRLDFEIRRDNIIKLAADYADHVGAGSASYARAFNRPVPSTLRTPTDDDWEVLFHLNAMAIEFNHMAASTATDDRDKLTALEYVAGQAGRSGIDFVIPNSSYSVPFPYGSTLEVLSGRYLGTPDRWHEIAVLNNLRAPYVDEEGFYRTLIVNGAGNDVQVSDADDFAIGQPVWISSNNVVKEKRRVTAIRTLTPSVHVISLSGNGDLDKFTTSAGSKLFAFLPGTVNSLQLIYIPSEKAAADTSLEARPNPDIDEFDALLRVGGVDLLLSESGDLAITKDGDCRLAQGLANIVQRARLAMDTPIGSLPRHPNYGFGVQPGVSTASVTAQDILRSARQTFAGDPTFTGVTSASIIKDGPSISIAMNVGIAGYSQLVPIVFKVKK